MKRSGGGMAGDRLDHSGVKPKIVEDHGAERSVCDAHFQRFIRQQ